MMKTKALILLSYFASIFVSFQNCGGRFQALSQGETEIENTLGDIGSAVPNNHGGGSRNRAVATKPMRILMVVDQSGSNNYDNTGTPGTGSDPDKKFRYALLNNYIDDNQNNNLISYGLISFKFDQAKAFINAGTTDKPTFTNDIAAVKSALGTLKSEADENATPYKAALQMVRTAISNDIAANGAGTYTYRVVFVTDGVPTDYGHPIDNQAIYADVALLVADFPELKFSTLYYGPNDPDAEERLKEMAKVGNGTDFNANTDPSITLFRIIGKAPTLH